MKRLRTQVIVNPESNQGKTRKRWKDIKEAIKSHIHEFKYEFTEKPLQAIDIARDAIKGGSELIIGVGGEVVKRVNQRRMERKASSYVRCLVSAMVNYKSRRMKIRVDGRELPEADYLVGAVANGRIFGKGMKVAPGAKLDDGFFDLVLVKGMKFLEFCRHGWKIFLGTHLTHPKISLVRGKNIEALTLEEGEVLLELDGEQLGGLPATFEILPRRFPIKGYI